MGNAALKYQDTEALTPISLFKALSDNTRLACVLLVSAENSLCVCELEHALGEDQPKISRHLALLRKDKIVDTERRGKWVYYHIATDLPAWAKHIIELTAEEEAGLIHELKQNLAKMTDRPSCC